MFYPRKLALPVFLGNMKFKIDLVLLVTIFFVKIKVA